MEGRKGRSSHKGPPRKKASSMNLSTVCQRLLNAVGYPAPLAELVDPVGVRRYIRGWPARPLGSVADIAAVYGLVDPDTVVRIDEERYGSWPLTMPRNTAILGATPLRRRAVVRAHWRRRELLTFSHKLLMWCEAVAREWLALEWDDVRVEHAWQE